MEQTGPSNGDAVRTDENSGVTPHVELSQRLAAQKVAPQLCSLLLDQATPDVLRYAYCDLLERLQHTAARTVHVAKESFQRLESRVLENHTDVEELKNRLLLAEAQHVLLKDEHSQLTSKLAALEAKSTRVTPARSTTANRNARTGHSAMSLTLEQQSAPPHTQPYVEPAPVVASTTRNQRNPKKGFHEDDSSDSSDSERDEAQPPSDT